MNVTLMTTMSDKRELNKSLRTIGNADCHIKDGTSIIDPIIIISKSTFDNVKQLNYAYIPDFNRYYFVNNVTVDTAQTMAIEMHVDVLYTYRAGIKNISTLIVRQENVYSDYLVDSMLPVRNNRFKIKRNVGEVGDGNYYYLTVNGGGEGIE